MSSKCVDTILAIKVPEWIFKEIDKRRRGFLWAGEETTSGRGGPAPQATQVLARVVTHRNPQMPLSLQPIEPAYVACRPLSLRLQLGYALCSQQRRTAHPHAEAALGASAATRSLHLPAAPPPASFACPPARHQPCRCRIAVGRRHPPGGGAMEEYNTGTYPVIRLPPPPPFSALIPAMPST